MSRQSLPNAACFAFLLALPAAVGGAERPLPEVVRFNEHVQPILSNNCFKCHGPDPRQRQAELRLDLREGATADLGERAAIVPGKPDQSELIRRVTADDEAERMPSVDSKKPALSPRDVALLRRWIEQGAKYEAHWAYLPLGNHAPPSATNAAWPRGAIDRFVLARQEDARISPSPEADRATLIRRVAIDLTGLLPSPDETQQFLRDSSPDAYEKLVERLLASPHYGERWGRHWLDQARYADSNGYAIDGEREIWPYRDWVIKAFNDDMPFDSFTIEQLAGDLVPNASKQQLIATAFHRNTLINQEGGSDPEQFRVEAAIDRVNTTAAVWLGLTVGCAQCHSHKFDAIAQREFYELFAFFNQGTDVNNAGATVPVAEGEVFGAPGVTAPKDRPKPVNLMIMKDVAEPRPTYLLTRGDFTRPDQSLGRLQPGVLKAVRPALDGPGPRTRLDLASWLVHRDNPLTPRVTVNRVWMRYFGRGLVETDEDFGTQGSLPTHPELLDWLSRELVERGWSLKQLHRLIVTSATYRQSSKARSELAEVDPRNLLLARQERLRVEAEVVRDAALAASGLLCHSIGGPSVRPPQPEGIYAFTQTPKKWATDVGSARYRRALYTMFYRSAPYPLLSTFDSPDFQTTCTRRIRSNTPLQALTLANDPALLEIAQALAARVVREVPGEAAAMLEPRLRRAFLAALCREPSPRELHSLQAYALGAQAGFAADAHAAAAVAPPGVPADACPSDAAAALVGVARVLLNVDNFITRE